MDHHPYSVNPSPSDFHLFGPLKKQLAGKQFAKDADIKQAVTWLQTLDTDFFYIKTKACHDGTNT
jgi:hypothetical protein